ncbi:hypothetical protein RB595_005100 [Gaeumannomyces hyphopodioides]
MATPVSGGHDFSFAFYEDDSDSSDSTQDYSPRIQNFTGGDDVYSSAQQLLQAPSIDVSALAALLERIPPESDQRPVRRCYWSPGASSALTVREEGEHAYEMECYQALLDDLLPNIGADPDAHAHLLRSWAPQHDLEGTSEKRHTLSEQWHHWKVFRKWQLSARRGEAANKEYLDIYGRDYFTMGLPWVEPSSALLKWVRDYGGDEKDVERHAEVVRSLLPQGFVIRRPLRLSPDPKTQDLWTTYVEHLAFEAEHLDRLAKHARILRMFPETPEGEYEAAKAKADQQQCRVDWVLSAIEKIEEEEDKAVAGEGSSGKTGSSKKMGPADDTDGLQDDVVGPRLGKRRRMGEADEDTADKDKTDETEEAPASMSSHVSQKGRSKRREPSTDEQEAKNDPEPESSDGPGSVPQASGAPAVSAVTTTTIPRPLTIIGGPSA